MPRRLSAFAHHVHVHIMTEVEPLSERQTPPDDNSGQVLRGDGENKPLDPAAVVSSTILPATGSEHAREVTDPSIDIFDPSDDSQQPTEKPPGRCDDSKRGVKRSREIEPMDHSGLERKIPRVLARVGAVQCLSPLSLEELKLLSTSEVGEELARCLEEPKIPLIQDVVRIMGIEKSFEIFKGTSEIQSKGGQIAADANYKKSPGGVFLALVKKAATKEQRDEIFKIDKQKQYVRKKKQKKRKALENRLRKQKEAQDQCTCSINGTGQNELVEMDVGGPVTSTEPAEVRTAGAVAENERGSVGGSTKQQELLAAEEFERTSDCNIEFEFHVD